MKMEIESEIDVSEYSYLWDGSESGWTLLHFNSNQESEPPKYMVVNTENKSVLIIEDDPECYQVERKMLEEGVQIVTKM
jgi:hypothetical protein